MCIEWPSALFVCVSSFTPGEGLVRRNKEQKEKHQKFKINLKKTPNEKKI